MNDLKQRLDEHVFRDNPFNEEVKERMAKRVLERGGMGSPTKKRMPYFAMAGAGVLLLILIFSGVEFSGMLKKSADQSGRLMMTEGESISEAEMKTDRNANLNELLKQSPKERKKLDKLSPAFRKKLRLPTFTPFEPIKITALVSDMKDGPPNLKLPQEVTFICTGKNGSVLTIEMVDQDHKEVQFDSDTIVKLADGTEAHWHQADHAVVLNWMNKKTGIVYGLTLDGGDHKYTKNDLVKIANTMDGPSPE